MRHFCLQLVGALVLGGGGEHGSTNHAMRRHPPQTSDQQAQLHMDAVHETTVLHVHMHQQHWTHPVTVLHSIPKHDLIHAPPSEVCWCELALVYKDLLLHSATESGHGPNLRVIKRPVHGISILWRNKKEPHDTVHFGEPTTSSRLPLPLLHYPISPHLL